MRPIVWIPSPNRDARPAGASIELIVLHAISLPEGRFDAGRIADLFLNRLLDTEDPALAEVRGLRVSAHFLVDRSGGITQFVPVGERAWHAGESSWCGRSRCNDFSVGIELLGDTTTPFTPAQYREAARLCASLMRRLPRIGRERIVGHADIAPGRKWDPGPQWDWARFHRSLARIRRLRDDFR